MSEAEVSGLAATFLNYHRCGKDKRAGRAKHESRRV